MDEEEPVDVKAVIDAKCSMTPACAKALVAYEMCGERIEAKGHGDCAGYFMDYVKCVDQCASTSLLKNLK